MQARKAQAAIGWIDVDLLAARHLHPGRQRVVASCEAGVDACRAGRDDVFGAVGGRVLADPEFASVGVDLAEMDRGGGAGAHDREGDDGVGRLCWGSCGGCGGGRG